MFRLKKFFSFAGKSMMVLSVASAAAGTLGFAYLQHVNSIIGPINVNKDDALQHYKKNLHLSDEKALFTYYWVLYRIAESRVFNYHRYSSNCEKLKSKIASVSL